MNKTSVAKKIVRLIVGGSTYYVVNAIIKNNVEPDSRVHRIETKIATVALGSAVAATTENWASSLVDSVVTGWNKAKAED
jgi:hypothetical protein